MIHTFMSATETQIELMENGFPSISGMAFAVARERVLASGQSVLQAENGVVYEVFPDGQKVVVKEIEKPVAVQKGQKIKLR